MIAVTEVRGMFQDRETPNFHERIQRAESQKGEANEGRSLAWVARRSVSGPAQDFRSGRWGYWAGLREALDILQ